MHIIATSLATFFPWIMQLTVLPPRPQCHSSARVYRCLPQRSRCCRHRSTQRKLHATGALLLLIFLLQILPLAFWMWIDCTMGNFIILQDKSDCTPESELRLYEQSVISKITPHAPLTRTHPPGIALVGANQISHSCVRISWSPNKLSVSGVPQMVQSSTLSL